MGVLLVVASMLVTRAVYAAEDAFEHLIHWMWWPALGGLAVGAIGYFSPHTMGVGYDNIERILSGQLAGEAVVVFCALKLVSWTVSLSTGTSGGMLAPRFTIGGGIGAAVGALAVWVLPHAGVDVRVAALVGMAALFAGASRALLASVVIAFDTTRQPMGLLPLLGGCTAAHLVSAMMMRYSIMTEKIARHGTRVVSEYTADFLEQVLVSDVASAPSVFLRANDTVEQVRARIASRSGGSSHQGFPVVHEDDPLIGVVTRRDILAAHARRFAAESVGEPRRRRRAGRCQAASRASALSSRRSPRYPAFAIPERLRRMGGCAAVRASYVPVPCRAPCFERLPAKCLPCLPVGPRASDGSWMRFAGWCATCA